MKNKESTMPNPNKAPSVKSLVRTRELKILTRDVGISGETRRQTAHHRKKKLK